MDQLHPRYAQLAAEVEQCVLDANEVLAHVARNAVAGEQHTDRGIQLVDGAVGFYPRRVLGRAGAVAEARGPVVAGAGVDLRKAVAHGDAIDAGDQCAAVSRKLSQRRPSTAKPPNSNALQKREPYSVPVKNGMAAT